MHTDWSELACRASKVLFARKGKSVKDVAGLLVEEKVVSARGLDAKLQRGTYSFALFLELMSVLGVDARSPHSGDPRESRCGARNDRVGRQRSRLGALGRERHESSLNRSRRKVGSLADD
ncbi:DUF6471 domain-containing protein [Cupriavidus necator]|uniref:DUF6471 domain-containing protein n=1 Tax=Cupriavidus necator TaxID=106590 RepID=UPI003F73AD07